MVLDSEKQRILLLKLVKGSEITILVGDIDEVHTNLSGLVRSIETARIAEPISEEE